MRMENEKAKKPLERLKKFRGYNYTANTIKARQKRNMRLWGAIYDIATTGNNKKIIENETKQ